MLNEVYKNNSSKDFPVTLESIEKKFTFSSESSDFDNCGIGFLGITRKCVGAFGLMSWKATHYNVRRTHNVTKLSIANCLSVKTISYLPFCEKHLAMCLYIKKKHLAMCLYMRNI